MASSALIGNNQTFSIPQWVIDVHEYRKKLFLMVVEPIIVALVGPVEVKEAYKSSLDCHGCADEEHRRLGFLPNYVEDVSSFHETSMSFATLCMLFVIMTCTMLIFASCFYHNQKTSPLFISPRRHRLPKLVPPPLPVDGAFSWVKVCFFLSDEEVRRKLISLVTLRFSLSETTC
jgi:hypothetical protein